MYGIVGRSAVNHESRRCRRSCSDSYKKTFRSEEISENFLALAQQSELKSLKKYVVKRRQSSGFNVGTRLGIAVTVAAFFLAPVPVGTLLTILGIGAFFTLGLAFTGRAIGKRLGRREAKKMDSDQELVDQVREQRNNEWRIRPDGFL